MLFAVEQVVKIAIPTWAGRVSPVFDVAGRLAVVDTEAGAAGRHVEESLDETDIFDRAAHVARLGVQVLIYGAVS
jgi:predicted Fe-Mo cluster-binding NifX family protein